jgi:dTMP kinase
MKPAPPVTIVGIALIYPEMFISLEGLDGSGKTTQARLLGERLTAEGVDVLLTREPGGTPLGEEIRNLVLHGDHVAPWAEAALYAASRAQHVEQVIRPALARGATVICDRYVDSSVVYQGVARGLGLERVLELNLAAVEGLMPDRTVLIEIGVDVAAERMGSTAKLDRLEREGDGFHERVASAYRELASRFPDRYVVVDGSRAPEQIAEEIHERLRHGS